MNDIMSYEQFASINKGSAEIEFQLLTDAQQMVWSVEDLISANFEEYLLHVEHFQDCPF